MESESLPPSMPMPNSHMISLSASAVSYMAAPSPGSFEAHIQLPSALMSPRDVHLAHTMFVTASPTDIRALAAPDSRPLMGCSPMAVTPPITGVPSGVTCECATTAQSERGVWRGPTHCCCAIRPVTERSTLLVRKRLEPTVTLDSTWVMQCSSTPGPSRDTRARITSGASAAGTRSEWLEWKVLGGSLPSTLSRGRSTGIVSSLESCTTTRPSPVMVPTTQ
mmetsp:Transcript_27831/g.40936  ORF Transcript_27831/g.40936 Transcript_27831/m.40936 type:complete len:222 (+) Transcript_27831:1755-2420(+)